MEMGRGNSRSNTGRRRKGASRRAQLARWLPRPLRKLSFDHVFVLAALLLGGAGIASAFANWLVVTLGLVVLARHLPAMAWSDLDRTARIAAALIGVALVLCLIQAMPLPRELWAALPGHALAAQVATVAGTGGWTAWSLSPDRTLDALTALVPPAAALVIAARSSTDGRRLLLRMILVVALLSAALAIVQVAAGPNSAPMLFTSRHRGLGVGLFVNRNHFALYLLFAMLIAALPGIPGPARQDESGRAMQWGLRTGALALLTLGVLATLSRTGIFLLPLALGAAILMTQRRRLRTPVLLGGVTAAGLVVLALRSAAPIQAILARYATAAEDFRFQYWENTWLALREALPLGTGLGTFTLVYPTYEPLDQVRPDVVNHAHNDVLEWVMEAGLPGALLLLAVLAFVALAVAQARKRANGRRERLVPIVAGAATVMTLAASMLDYPVRMHAIAVTLALLVGMLLQVRSSAEDAAQKPGLRRRVAWAAPLTVLGLLTLSSQWGLQLARAGQVAPAAVLAPWYSPVQATAANRFYLLQDARASSAAARRTLAISPLEPSGLRGEGLALIALGQPERGAQLMSLGARLGWRDGVTQLWLIEQALAARADAFAIQRMDAVMRQGKFDAELLPMLPPLLQREGGRAGLAEQLAANPGWRTAFFNAVARDRTWTMPQLLDLVARLRRAGSPVTAPDTALIRAALAEAGRYGEVRQVWRVSGQSALVGDGAFESTPGELPHWSAPYSWYAPKLTGVRVEVAQAEIVRAGQALAVTSDGLAQGAALAQVVALTPGRYRVALSVTAEDKRLPGQLAVGLACRRRPDEPAGVALSVPLAWSDGRDGAQIGRGTMSIPAGCPGQLLTLAIPQTTGRPFSFWVDDVSIRSAP